MATTQTLERRIKRLEARRQARALIRFGSPFDVMRRGVGDPDPWQQELLGTDADQVLVLCHRQAGKSTTAAALALAEALTKPDSVILLISRTYRQSGLLFRKVLRLYRKLGKPVAYTSLTRRALELVNGSIIESLPGTEETIRGYSGVTLLIIDEASRVADELYYAVRPMLGVSRGRLVAMTTAWGKVGWFYEAWTEGAGFTRITARAADCPRIDADWLARERISMPEAWYSAEYDCVFMDGESAVFLSDQVDRVFSHEVEPLALEVN